MSAYTNIYLVRNTIASIQQQTEVAVVTAANDIKNEDQQTPDHSKRIKWAYWVDGSSSIATIPFMWPVAMNPSIQASIVGDPTGASVPDADVQFVVNSNLNQVIAGWKEPIT